MPGVGLSEDGRTQTEALTSSLARRPIAAVVSSPSERAQQTAAPIASQFGLRVWTDPGFEEIDFGSWTGRSFADLEHDPAWHAWNQFRSAAACPGGETMLAAQARALAALQALWARHRAAEVVVVSHQDVLKAVLTHFLGAPLDLLHRLALDPAHRGVLVLGDAHARVDALNLPP